MKKVIATTSAPGAIGPYSQAIDTGTFVFASGLTVDNVVKTTVFLSDMANFAAMNDVYGKVFTEPYPARSAVAVRELPKGVLVEIEVLAAR